MQNKTEFCAVKLPANNCQQSIERSNEQSNYQFYKQYKKIYQTTLSLSVQMKDLIQRKEAAWEKLGKFEKKAEQFRDDIRGQAPERKKRSRRLADDIQRDFKCQIDRCFKSYGTEGSLFQHFKLKHPQIYEEMKKKKSYQSDSGSEQAISQ